MKTSLLLLVIVLVLPINLFAQYKRETGLSVGVVIPNQSKNYSSDTKIGSSTKFGFTQSWYKPETKFSFRPAVGINLARLTVNNLGWGGNAGGSLWNGSILSLNAEAGILTQFQIKENTFLAVGPAIQYLITNYEDLTRNWWYLQQASGVEETNEFNRKYFLKPSFGVKAMLLNMQLHKKISLGLSFEYQFRNDQEYQEINSYDEIFQYSKTTEISFYLGRH